MTRRAIPPQGSLGPDVEKAGEDASTNLPQRLEDSVRLRWAGLLFAFTCSFALFILYLAGYLLPVKMDPAARVVVEVLVQGTNNNSKTTPRFYVSARSLCGEYIEGNSAADPTCDIEDLILQHSPTMNQSIELTALIPLVELGNYYQNLNYADGFALFTMSVASLIILAVRMTRSCTHSKDAHNTFDGKLHKYVHRHGAHKYLGAGALLFIIGSVSELFWSCTRFALTVNQVGKLRNAASHSEYSVHMNILRAGWYQILADFLVITLFILTLHKLLGHWGNLFLNSDYTPKWFKSICCWIGRQFDSFGQLCGIIFQSKATTSGKDTPPDPPLNRIPSTDARSTASSSQVVPPTIVGTVVAHTPSPRGSMRRVISGDRSSTVASSESLAESSSHLNSPKDTPTSSTTSSSNSAVETQPSARPGTQLV